MSDATTTKVIAQKMMKKLIAHMKANGIAINGMNQDKYFNPKSGRISIRNNNPQIGIPYEDNINLNNMLGDDPNIPNELTWISECEGDLNLSLNKLTTLEGCPQRIYGDFSVTGNTENLFLLGFPEEVKGNIDLTSTNVKGLKYLPRTIIKDLLMSGCSLTDLNGCPEIVNGNFDVSVNHDLLSLENGPSSVVGTYSSLFTTVENFIYAPTNPEFKGFNLMSTVSDSAQALPNVKCWAGFKPAMDDYKTKMTIQSILDLYTTHRKGSRINADISPIVIGLGTYLTIRESKPELDTSIEARKEYAMYNPSSLEDYKSKADTKQYEGIDINFIKMLKAALLK